MVRSKRIGGKVRQHTLLNLGTKFSLPREQWPELASRIQNIIDGQLEICKTPQAIEELAQTYAAQIIQSRQEKIYSALKICLHPGTTIKKTYKSSATTEVLKI